MCSITSKHDKHLTTVHHLFFFRLVVKILISRSFSMPLTPSSPKCVSVKIKYVFFFICFLIVFLQCSSVPVFFKGQADLFCKFQPRYFAPWLPRLLDLWWLSDHTSSVWERYLDCLQRTNQRQLCTGMFAANRAHSATAEVLALCPRSRIALSANPLLYYDLNKGLNCSD